MTKLQKMAFDLDVAKGELEELRTDLLLYRAENKKLQQFCLAFSFVLPEPHKDKADCVTTSELYRIQHKMARGQWLDWINNPKTDA